MNENYLYISENGCIQTVLILIYYYVRTHIEYESYMNNNESAVDWSTNNGQFVRYVFIKDENYTNEMPLKENVVAAMAILTNHLDRSHKLKLEAEDIFFVLSLYI